MVADISGSFEFLDFRFQRNNLRFESFDLARLVILPFRARQLLSQLLQTLANRLDLFLGFFVHKVTQQWPGSCFCLRKSCWIALAARYSRPSQREGDVLFETSLLEGVQSVIARFFDIEQLIQSRDDEYLVNL